MSDFYRFYMTIVHLMASEMGCKTIVLSFWMLFALTKGTTIDLKSTWMPDLGWQATCSWKLFSNDSLQSVRLYNAERQFMVYRPEKDGTKSSKLFNLPESTMQVDCEQTAKRGLTGICVLTLELFQPPNDDYKYKCEVSGERPMFMIEDKDIVIKALVEPRDAEIEATHTSINGSSIVILNCSSSGLPTPILTWTSGEQKIANEYSNKAWNMTSKLWHVWSTLNHTADRLPVTCTPEIRKGDQLIIGKGAVYNSASGVFSAKIIIMAVLLSFIFRR